MIRSEAERMEDQLDDVLATSLHNEVDRNITVRVSDPQLVALRADHRAAWRILNGPLTASIVVVLDLGPFHLAWDITEPEEAPLARLLEQGRAGATRDRCAKRLHPSAQRALVLALSGVVGWRDPPRRPSGSGRDHARVVQPAARAISCPSSSAGGSTSPRRPGGEWNWSSASHWS